MARANVGVRTDEVPRIDIDLPEVADALAQDTVLPSETEVVRTPRGGMHIAVISTRPAQGGPLYLQDGDLAWLTEDGRLLRSDGSELLALGEGAFVVAYRWRKIDLDPSARRLALTYRASAQDYLGVFSIDRRFNTLFSVPAFAMVGGWVSSNLLIGNAAISAEDLSTPPLEPFVG